MAKNVERPSPEKDESGRFVTGNIGGGRPKGSRNKLGEAFVSALQEDFQEHGVGAIVEVRETRPADYLKVVASLLPKEFVVKKPEDELSDEEMDAALDAIGRLLERRGIAGGSKPTHKGQGTA